MNILQAALNRHETKRANEYGAITCGCGIQTGIEPGRPYITDIPAGTVPDLEGTAVTGRRNHALHAAHDTAENLRASAKAALQEYWPNAHPDRPWQNLSPTEQQVYVRRAQMFVDFLVALEDRA
ncbi:hypothetical protein [Brevibacterium moorei]|uniref:hypothetical protein n=1 Tax=Brevibacterium moorei TaxID=2968457 RepID=UPI00211C6966|nr:hypothetical protein [Brevibacterium sp. 68QC2CO]MCQ9384408.1 hypothetical protein [Brevibacterium sp. 68QC2CO]